MSRVYRLRLLGPVQLLDPDGREITPRGAKCQALLAILATSRGRPWHRAALQDLLWSDRDQAHGRDSLKKALRELRRAFGPDAPRVLRGDRGPVALDVSCVSVDIFDGDNAGLVAPHRAAFLEGLDVPDPEFDRWLASVRAALAEPDAAAPRAPSPEPDRPRLLVERPAAQGGDGFGAVTAEMIVDRVVHALRAYELLDLVDLRHGGAANLRPSDTLLGAKALFDDGRALVSMSLRRAHDGRVIWTGREAETVARLVAGGGSTATGRIVDQICAVLLSPSAPGDEARDTAARQAMLGVDRLFELCPDSAEAAARAFARAIEIDPRGPYYAWYAFLTCIRLENSAGHDLAALRDHADEIAARALELDPHNPLSRSLLTHVYAFLFRDYQRAATLIEPLLASPPDIPFFHHSLAMLRLYMGDPDAARPSAARAEALGRDGPYAFAFTTGRQMVEAVGGDLERAAELGERALALRPRGRRSFGPTLRYQLAIYARKGDEAAAERIWRRMKEERPGLTADSIDDEKYPIPNPAARRMIRASLRQFERTG